MAVRTFPFEVLAVEGIKVVEARETEHPLIVIHPALPSDRKAGKWNVTHGPTSAVVQRFHRIADAKKLARALAQVDPSGEGLFFEDPEPTMFKGSFNPDWIPVEAWDLFRAAFELTGRNTSRMVHPLEQKLGTLY